MVSRERMTSFKCAEDGCNDHAHYGYRTNKDYAELHKDQQARPYECVRHHNRHEVLRPDNLERTHVVVASKVMADQPGTFLDGLFWTAEEGEVGSRFTFGPGFRAHTQDFPEGTRLVVTARIVLPDTQPERAAQTAHDPAVEPPTVSR